MSEPKLTGDEINDTNEERKHLEGLLKDRINFHLLFAAVFMAGLSSMDDPKLRFRALLVITILSFLIFLAVLRTTLLVQKALKEIWEFGPPRQPYRRYCDAVWFLPNANHILLAVPVVLTIAFGSATAYYWKQSLASAGVGPVSPCVVYQIDDSSVHGNAAGSAVPAEKAPAKGSHPR
jgi:hypothetical protein